MLNLFWQEERLSKTLFSLEEFTEESVYFIIQLSSPAFAEMVTYGQVIFVHSPVE